MNKMMEKAGDVEIEIRQSEMRASALKAEILNLEKRKASLLEEANGIRLNVEADASKRITEGREATKKMLSEREILEVEKKAFGEQIAALHRDQAAVQRAKEEAQSTVDGYKKMQDKLTRFIVMVKRESELL